MKEEPFVDFPGGRAAVAPLTHLRSTLLGASILALKHHGLYERYLAQLPDARRDEILLAVAGQWLPIELGEIHYNACDAMGLPEDEIVAIAGRCRTSPTGRRSRSRCASPNRGR